MSQNVKYFPKTDQHEEVNGRKGETGGSPIKASVWTPLRLKMYSCNKGLLHFWLKRLRKCFIDKGKKDDRFLVKLIFIVTVKDNDIIYSKQYL